MSFYTPADKAKYYGNQLKTKQDKNGTPLTKRQLAYRAGFVSCFSDSVAAFKSKDKKAKNKQ